MKIQEDLGSRQGSKHSIPDLRRDINTLMDSLKEHEVYVVKNGRTVDSQDSPVPDVLTAGLAALGHGSTTNPIAEFNAQFDRLRERYKLTPVSLDRAWPSRTGSAIDPTIASEVTAMDTELPRDPTSPTSPTPPLPTSLEDSDDEPVWGGQPLADSPTLPRLDECDVELDMDEWRLDGEWEGTDSESEAESEGDV